MRSTNTRHGSRVVESFQGADGEHQVVITVEPAGRWQVLDIAGEQSTIVDILSGFDDGPHQAESLARDYARRATTLPPSTHRESRE
jgi:hypothetical protein